MHCVFLFLAVHDQTASFLAAGESDTFFKQWENQQEKVFQQLVVSASNAR
jgi:hypothetical protein